MLLLVAGFVAGPATGLLNPDELFGDLLFPGVSLAVGLLLFDGGLQLKVNRIQAWRGIVSRLVTLGVLVTWVIASVAVTILTDLEGRTAWLAGAVLVVSGPTVVIPILRRTNPNPPSSEILEWEGILIDPIGAVLGVAMLDVVLHGDTAIEAASGIAATAAAGIGCGIGGAALAIGGLKVPGLPGLLRAPIALAAAVAAYTVANVAVPEAGLFATTVVGLILANQKITPVDDVAAFEEGVGVLALGGLFVVLGARMSPSAVVDVLGPGLALLVILIVIARPLTVLVSTARSGIDRQSSLFMMALAPRGIVAAAAASVFALELEAEGRPGGETLVSLTFVVIIGAGIVYGLGAGPVGRRLGVITQHRSEPNQPTGSLNQT